MPARVAFTLDDLATNIPKIFEQVQTTTANHQKNYVALYKLHVEAAKHTEPVQNGQSIKLVGERAFEDTFISMLSRALPVKKGASVVDRVIKFAGGYTKFINEKALEERRKNAAENGSEEDDEEDDDTTASRFVSRLLRFLFKGCLAKDKIIRFRVVQCIAEMVAHLGEIDEDIYMVLKSSLLERLRDKETNVRVQAAVALSKLCGSEEDPKEEPKITDVMIDTMKYDTAADVRRAALLNLPINQKTLPAILSRTRDIDPPVRKLVYSAVLEPNCVVHQGDRAAVGVTHPRALSIAQRELVVRNGLGDREESVKNAATKLLSTWVDVVRVDGAKSEGSEVEADVVAFLGLFDLVENSTPEEALLNVFKSRADILDALEFGHAFWESMTPEKALLARVFVDHCVAAKDDRRLEAALPEVTALAFRIQAAYNNLIEDIQADQEDDLLRGGMLDDEEEERRAKREEARLDREFIIGEMLRMAVNLDYADEIGRRKMFMLVRDMISQDVLPERLVARCLDILRKLSSSERDLIRLVVEVIHELRDPEEEEPVRDTSAADDASTVADTPATVKTVRPAKPPQEKTPEQQARADAIDIRCLSLCIGMLERVMGTFEENSTLEGILGELIIPAVRRREMALRERGLISLGLCCLIARRMALNSFQLFLSQIQAAPEVLKIRVLQIVFDILMVHDRDFLGPGSANGEKIIEFLLRVLDEEESDKVQALICVGMSKLMLSGMISDDRVLQSLILVYVSPETADNQELRQCLSYFFPVYCYSSPANQRRMQKAFIPVWEKLTEAYKEWDGDEDMITPAQASLMFVDWTDPQKATVVAERIGQKVDHSIHIDLASDIVKAMFNEKMDKDDKKALCQLLGKLYIPDEVDDDKIRTLKLLMANLRVRRPPRDTVTKNAFSRFQTAIEKKFEKQLADFDEDDYRQLEYLKELFEFLDEITPDSDFDDDEPAVRRKNVKRRSESVVTDTTSESGVSESGSPPPDARRKGNGKSKAKRRRVSESADEDDETPTERGTPPAEAPSRVLPKRASAAKSRVAVSKSLAPPLSESEASEDDDEEDTEETPAPNRIRKPVPQPKASSKTREAARLDSEIDDLLERNGHDSIMDSSEDEDADEVDDLLGDDAEV